MCGERANLGKCFCKVESERRGPHSTSQTDPPDEIIPTRNKDKGGRNDGMTEWQNEDAKGRLTLASSFVIQSYRQTDDGSFGRSLTMTICND